MLKIAVLISGGGSNLQSIIDSIESGILKCEIKYVISDRVGALGLNRAESRGIPTQVIDRKIYGDKLSEEVLRILDGQVDFIILAGFLSILKGMILAKYKNRIINIHPALIPSFSGTGMYGIKVHEKAIETGVKISGCTVHFVDEDTDSGPIILQRSVPVYYEDDAKTLQKRVLGEEHKALPDVLKLLVENRVIVENNRVKILQGAVIKEE